MKRTLQTSVVTVAALIDGRMVMMERAKNPHKPIFVICCEYGDWSGFRTLAECERQYPELEKKGRGNFFYWVEER